MKDTIAILKEDHVRIKSLLKQLVSASPPRRADVLEKAKKEITTHTAVEEEIVYPAYRAAAKKKDRHLFFEAQEEHHVVKLLLPELKATPADAEELTAKAMVLQKLVEQHIKEEERSLLPNLRKLLTKQQLSDMAEQIHQRKLTIEEQQSNPFVTDMREILSIKH